jgi:hypothetical protein
MGCLLCIADLGLSLVGASERRSNRNSALRFTASESCLDNAIPGSKFYGTLNGIWITFPKSMLFLP